MEKTKRAGAVALIAGFLIGIPASAAQAAQAGVPLPVKTYPLVVAANSEFPQTVDVNRRDVKGNSWQTLNAKNGQGSVICWNGDENYLCFGLRCGKGRGAEFVHFFSGGSYKNGRRFPVYVDGKLQTTLLINAVEPTSELVTAYDPNQHAKLFDALKSGSTVTIGYDRLISLTLRGSSKQLTQVAQQCNIPTSAAPVVGAAQSKKVGAKKLVADSSLNILFSTDLAGGDYRNAFEDTSLQNISEEQCQKLCINDLKCDAYTFNTGRRFCFLKNGNFTRKSHRSARSGIVTSRTLIDPPAANARFSRNAITQTIARITREYQPAAASFDYTSTQQAADTLDAGVPEERTVDVGPLEVLPWLHKRYYDNYDMDQALAGTVEPTPKSHLFVSAAHRDLMRVFDASKNKYGGVDQPVVRKIHAGLYEVFKATTRDHGANHPRAGVVLMDLAFVTNYLAKPDNISDADYARVTSDYKAIYRQAAAMLRTARSGNPQVHALLIDHHIWAGILGGVACGEADSATLRDAIALHRRYKGDEPAQLGWLSTLTSCAKDSAQKIQLMEAGVGLARGLDNPRALSQSLIDLGRAHFLAGQKAHAQQAFVEAFRIHHVELAPNKPDMDFVPYGNVVGEETWRMLKALGLDAELDLYLARTIQHQIASEFMSSNVGISWVSSFSDVLEASGRTEIADQYYTWLGAIDTVPSPVGYMISVADQRLDRQSFGSALRIMQRALPIARALGKPSEEFQVLTNLARAHHERGDFDNALKHGRDALKIVKAGLKLGQEDNWKLDTLRTLIAETEAEQGNEDAHALALAETMNAQLEEACRPGGNFYGFPVVPRSVLLDDPIVQRAFLETDVVPKFLECFRNNREKLEGIYSGPWKKQQNSMTVAALRDAIFLLALSGDREGVDELVGYVLNEADWTYQKSDAVILSTIFPDRLRKEPRNELLNQTRGFYSGNLFAAHGALVRGLLEAGKAEWLEPHFARMQEISGPKAVVHPSILRKSVDERLMNMVLDLHTIGKVQLAKNYYESLRPLAIKYRFRGGTECDWVSECEFLAFFDRLYGNVSKAENSLQNLPNRYVTFNSGAGVSAAEENAISAAALDEGKRHERAGRYRIAQAYYGIAGMQDIDSLLAIEDPLISIDTIRASASLARIAHKLGNDERAQKITGHFLTTARRKIAERTMLGSNSIMRWSHRLRDIFETHLDAAPADGSGTIVGDDNHFLALQYLQATRTADTVAKLSLDGIAGDLARRQQDLADKLSKLHSRLNRTGNDRAADLLRQISELEEENAQLTQTVEQQAPEALRQSGFRFPDLAETRSLLREGEVLLLAFTGRDHTYLWLIDRNKDRLIRSSASPAEVESLVRGLRAGVKDYLETPQDALNTKAWALAPFHAPYRSLFADFGPQLETASRVIFVPTGAFDSLPLGALLTASPALSEMTAAQMRAARLPWLIRKQAVNVLPSVSAMESLAQGKRTDSRHARQFLGIGNPDFSSGLEVAALPTRSVSTQRVEISPLPDTAQEVSAIADILGGATSSDLLLAQQANEETVKATDLSQYAIINFATHGVLAGEIPGLTEPALILATPAEPSRRNDGLLKASEISALRLDADLVLLSACNTAGSDGRPGAEGLSGLARSFFQAGARSLIVTHWEIPSKPAVDLAVGTIARQTASGDRDWATALQGAVIDLIDQKGEATNTHPAAWGAHMVVGMR